MNALSLSWASIRSRPLQSGLCVCAAGLGIAVLCTVFLISQAIEDGFLRNARGIDIVVGAKGSPLQLVLSSVYHADVPIANIEEKDVGPILADRRVDKAIPLALGDNHHGFRIVGTTHDYPALYGGLLAQGVWWNEDFEVVAGSSTGLKSGDVFPAVHGMEGEGDDVHHFHDYKVVGVMQPTGTVLDRLILASVDSVHQLHMHPDLGDPDAAEDMKMGHQITALLLNVRNRFDVMNMPRHINKTTNLQAASPAYEMTRLASSLGFSKDTLAVLGGGLVLLSALMLLSSLSSSLVNRRYDLAVLRVLGASPAKLFATVMGEGVILALAGALLGVLAGHVLAMLIAENVPTLRGIANDGFLTWRLQDGVFLLIGLAMGVAASLLPAVAASKADIAALLARGRA